MELEREFSKVLMLRQIMGRAVLSQVRPSQTHGKEALVNDLSAMLSLFGPRRLNLNPMVVAIVDEAVDLSNQMAEEQAIFVCQMPKTGTLPNENPNIRVADENQTGRVFMCSFPGFGRRIIDDGQEKVVWLVKTNAELQSGFSVEKAET
jgi:hypothetical protein